MKCKKILPVFIFSALLFAACGDDSSSASAAPSAEESSSSVEEGEDSSSSEKDDAKSSSSSAAILEGARAAELTDLQKNYELKLFDQTVYLSTGSKQGVLALRIPDELWVVTYTDFADGVVSFKKDNAGLQYSETDAVKKIIGKMDAGFKISFVVKEADNADENDIILYSVDGGDYSEAVKASVAVQKSKVSKAETIQKKIYECADGDSTRTFKFFDSSYAYETSVGDNVVNKHEGHYDIQRSTLLMLPLREEDASLSMFIYSVGTDSTITSQSGESMDCTIKDVE
ncbi:hypothetical protein [Fibrobacter sp. UBA3629]|uniref:hypothetical protein n=1 Tax=Fibrobacter sp. UBA3629 TaxID=1946530 RepID=UPI0025C2301E|nr:hypothetical protein [Fibrobacter sp. UBA3629]